MQPPHDNHTGCWHAQCKDLDQLYESVFRATAACAHHHKPAYTYALAMTMVVSQKLVPATSYTPRNTISQAAMTHVL